MLSIVNSLYKTLMELRKHIANTEYIRSEMKDVPPRYKGNPAEDLRNFYEALMAGDEEFQNGFIEDLYTETQDWASKFPILFERAYDGIDKLLKFPLRPNEIRSFEKLKLDWTADNMANPLVTLAVLKRQLEFPRTAIGSDINELDIRVLEVLANTDRVLKQADIISGLQTNGFEIVGRNSVGDCLDRLRENCLVRYPKGKRQGSVITETGRIYLEGAR